VVTVYIKAPSGAAQRLKPVLILNVIDMAEAKS